MWSRTAVVSLGLCLAACGAHSSDAPQTQPLIRQDFFPQESGYSDMVKVGQTVFLAGQLPLDEQENTPPDPEAQVRLVWHNIDRRLKAVGGSLHDVVFTQTFITKPEYREQVNKVRIELFPKHAPTSTKLVISALMCPDCIVEIDAIAVLGTKLVE